MIKYSIMAFILGFSGNKLFNKKDKSIINCIKWACIVGSVFMVLHVALIII